MVDSDSEWGAPKTLRPDNDLVRALEAEQPAAAFLERMREQMAPGPWQVETEHGFWWIPHHLRHSIEVFTNTDPSGSQRLVCASDFLLVEDIEDLGNAYAMCMVFNQRSFGGAVWLDEQAGRIHLTSSVHLDPSRWFNAHVFESTVQRLVGISEWIAPRLAVSVDGQPALAMHPEFGQREEPDQFVHEALLPTFQPEAATGVWWSRTELLSLRHAVRFFAPDFPGFAVADGGSGDESTSSDNFFTEMRFDWDHGPVSMTMQESDHPDLGVGLELLLGTPVRIDGAGEPPEPPADPIEAMITANLLNVMEAEHCTSPLSIGAWLPSRGQLFHTTFLMAEVARTLQQLAAPRTGETLGVMFSEATSPLGVLKSAMVDYNLFGAEWATEDRRLWNGVTHNATYVSLFGDDVTVTQRLVDGIELNVPLDPIELDEEAWRLQRSHLIASMGIFNPAGPTVGTIEVIVNYTLGRALLVERVRHPFSPSMRLHAVMDQAGFVEQLETLVASAVAALPWSTFDWFDVRYESDSVVEAVHRGLNGFAQHRDDDFGGHAFSLLETLHDPWQRLDSGFEPSRSLDSDDAGARWWIGAITDSRNIDNHVAYLRSAWEGATQFGRGDIDAAQQISEQCRAEVVRRGGVG